MKGRVRVVENINVSLDVSGDNFSATKLVTCWAGKINVGKIYLAEKDGSRRSNTILNYCLSYCSLGGVGFLLKVVYRVIPGRFANLSLQLGERALPGADPGSEGVS